VVAVLGVIDRLERRPPGRALVPGSTLVLLGRTEATVAGSRWASERRGRADGALPTLDFDVHTRLLALVAAVIAEPGLATSVHDVSSGGLALALTECAMAGAIGCVVDGVDGVAALFSESPSRVVLGTSRPDDVLASAAQAGVDARVLGTTGGDNVAVDGLLDVPVAVAVDVWRRAIPDALGEAVGV
jgi:phosphoribosylformylglycinamidine synthase